MLSMLDNKGWVFLTFYKHPKFYIRKNNNHTKTFFSKELQAILFNLLNCKNNEAIKSYGNSNMIIIFIIMKEVIFQIPNYFMFKFDLNTMLLCSEESVQKRIVPQNCT